MDEDLAVAYLPNTSKRKKSQKLDCMIIKFCLFLNEKNLKNKQQLLLKRQNPYYKICDR